MIYWLKRNWNGLKRWLSWRKVIWNNYDWDYSPLFVLIAEKLGRMEEALLNGHHERGITQKSIRVARKLAHRQAHFDYAERFHRKHDVKWGPAKMTFHEDGQVTFPRAKVVSVADEVKERAEFNAGFRTYHRVEDRERRWLFAIMNKYIIVWWD